MKIKTEKERKVTKNGGEWFECLKENIFPFNMEVAFHCKSILKSHNLEKQKYIKHEQNDYPNSHKNVFLKLSRLKTNAKTFCTWNPLVIPLLGKKKIRQSFITI